MGILRVLALPLLDKELTEQAARRRTYIIRVAYAVVLFGAFLVYFNHIFSRVEHANYRTLGVGRDMFEFLVWAQFVGVLAFLPGMMSGAVAGEKERGSLSLLLLTDLGPWEILVQKYIGRLIPMLSFLLLSLPLMAVAYGFGGMSPDYVVSGVWLLVLTCLQVGAHALMMSTICRTTGQAFVGSYLFLALFYLALPLLGGVTARNAWSTNDLPLFIFFPAAIFDACARRPFEWTAAASIPAAISTGVFLVLSRVFLVRRAFVKPRDLALGLFASLDRLMKWANRVTGNIMVIRGKPSLPGSEPVAWREVTKKALGRPHYLLRVVVAAEVPIVYITIRLIAKGGDTGALSVTAFILWGLAALAVSVKSASAIVTERSRQTLDTLLTTPMSGRQIVLQKMRAVWRLIYVLWIPFLSIFLVEAFAEGISGGSPPRAMMRRSPGFGTFDYLASSILAAVIYLPMLAWVAFWVGLRSRGRSRAIIVMLAGVVGWCAAPILLLAGLGAVGAYTPGGGLSYLAMLSPVSLIGATEFASFGEFGGDEPLVPITLNYLWHGGVLFFFRHLCLGKADRYLGRV